MENWLLQFFPHVWISFSEYPLTQTKSTYLNASSSIRDHRARVITIKVGIDDLSASLGDDPQKRRHFEDKLIRSGISAYRINDRPFLGTTASLFSDWLATVDMIRKTTP